MTRNISPVIAAAALVALSLVPLVKAKSSKNEKLKAASTYLMIGDIGGTNCRLGLYKPGSDKADFERIYSNSACITDDTKSFAKDIFLPFLQESGLDLSSKTIVACFAIAGPVKDNRVVLSNLNNTVIDGAEIEACKDGLLANIKRCKIINDFVGQGYGLLDLDLDTEVVELIPGSKERMSKTGPKACLGAGTGLGECYLTTSSLHPEEGYECYASEGGHVDYTPRSELEVKLSHHLQKKFHEPYRISAERIISGRGLANVYDFLAKTFPKKENTNIQAEFQEAGDLQGKVVGMSANDDNHPCELCVQAMEIMMSAYGAEAGNCAVKFIPTGGLYVSGGLTPKNIKFIQGEDSPFMKAYKDKGRLSGLVKDIPLFAVMVEDIGLRGARVCAMREYCSMN